MSHRDIHFYPTDPMNPSLGYSIRIIDAMTGEVLLHTSEDMLGNPLTLQTCADLVLIHSRPIEPVLKTLEEMGLIK
jgi:hypothetical protein